MKSIREIFKTNPSLLEEPEVAQLLDYCEQLHDEIVKITRNKTNKKANRYRIINVYYRIISYQNINFRIFAQYYRIITYRFENSYTFV